MRPRRIKIFITIEADKSRIIRVLNHLDDIYLIELDKALSTK
ncbi:hypothetical protein PCC7424_1413 [Gloeothece citriformis PCC 7424]|uniref:Uncharacterized protein n=1 Tax=Gloeothece citriformis (strain PCC 7424) TaxID=65393 RepID=B7K897_GLOC7|nr:hypothetical protein PCC7424_1413 [Gloeothece citriformis PCC 7424]